MQQSISPIVGQNSFAGKKGQEYRNIRAKSTGTPQIITDNSFLKQSFIDIPLTDIIDWSDFKKPVPSKENMQRLIKAVTGYLALYGKELTFTPSGKFGRDMTNLIRTVTSLLPKGQLLNVDYTDNEFIFVVYQYNPNRCWDIITYIPVSIIETMRPKIRNLFIRFVAFIMQQNCLPTIKSSYEYDIFVKDIKCRMKDQSEEVDECYIQAMRSYENKKGKANRMLQRIDQCDNYQPDALLAELNNLQPISSTEEEQVQCMIRGLKLLSQDSLINYDYDDTFDNISCQHANETVNWNRLIYLSWGVYDADILINYHYESLSDRCNNFGAIEPSSYLILSSEKFEKLTPCTFPFEWLDYICNDFYKHLTINE